MVRWYWFDAQRQSSASVLPLLFAWAETRAVGSPRGGSARESLTHNRITALSLEPLAQLYLRPQALPLLRAVGDRRNEAVTVTCYNMTLIYENQCALDQAIAYLERSIELALAVEHPFLPRLRQELEALKHKRDCGNSPMP